MPKERRTVIRGRGQGSKLPDWSNEGVAVVTLLKETGLLDQIESRFRIQRSGGYVGIDAVLHLLYYFSSNLRVGLKAFDGWLGEARAALAAVGGRKGLATQSSMSRVLGDVTLDAVREVAHWILRDCADVIELLRHPAMMTTDALERLWQVFDYDPTKSVLNQRALPEGEDLPPAQRRADGFAKPGYSGRKRGEVQVNRSALQHAGSSIWLDSRLEPGNGDRRPQLASALTAITEVCGELEHPLSRALVRLDGEFGDVPSLTALREAGVCAITRLNRPRLLDQPDVRRRMATHTWHFVPDSRSGPRRSAMDLGTVTVVPGKETCRDDGTPYDPLDVGVIVTRYPREREAEHGRVIGGWQYELFAALDLDAESWPAPDVVASYYGRGGQENRFAQEDRELGLDHIFSFTLAGQELACLVGLLVWNLRVVNGFRLDPLPEERVPAPRRVTEVDTRPVPEGFVEEVEPVEQVEPPEPPVARDPDEILAELLSALNWRRFLDRHPNWTFDGVLRCPHGEELPLSNVTQKVSRKTDRLSFRAPNGTCRDCPLRDRCLGSVDADAVKMVTLTVPKPAGAKIATQLVPVQLARRLERSAEAHTRPLPSGRRRKRPTGEPLVVCFPDDQQIAGEKQISDAQFLPARARAAFREACRDIAVQATLVVPRPERVHPYRVTTRAQRQNRRLTWAERNARYALPEGAQLRVVIEGGERIARILQLA